MEATIQPDQISVRPEPVVWIENLSVRYRIPKEKVSSIKEFAIRWMQQRITYEEFWALKDASLQIYPGELFGIVGRNGAGKSTLLKVVAGLLHPAKGRVIVRGRVAPLLDLGAGFHPELTGSENVYLFGTLLGLSRDEIDGLFKSIVDFAELWDFVDTPVKRYSSGMYIRLGFSVAVHSDPGILLVDEVLAVGDADFQEKCRVKMQEFQSRSVTIVIVTHALGDVEEFCHRAIWLDGGRIIAEGDPREVVQRYREGFIHATEAAHPLGP